MTPGRSAAADSPQRPVLFVNPRSGGGKAADPNADKKVAPSATTDSSAAHGQGGAVPKATDLPDPKGPSGTVASGAKEEG